MLKELLKKLGYTDEDIAKIEKGLSEEKVFLTKEENIDDRYTKLKAQKESLESENTSLKATQTSIQTEYENYKKGAISQEDYEAKKKEIEDASKVELEKTKLDNKIDIALMGASTRNIKAAKALLNLDNVKLDGDKLLGFDDQVEALKKSDAYLFDIKESKNQGAGSNNQYQKDDVLPPDGESKEDQMLKAMGLK